MDHRLVDGQQNALVSIVMPTYNADRSISQSIDSILGQSYPLWELLVVDDCSTDATPQILDYYQRNDSRIRVFRNSTNKGPAECRNYALRNARGRWIAFLDSDDIWLPNKLKRQLAFMKHRGARFSFTDYEHINTNGHLEHVRVSGPARISHRGFRRYCWVGCLTVMYDARVVGVVQVPLLKNREDYALWLKVSRRAICFRVPEVLAYYRDGQAHSMSSGGPAHLVKYHYQMFRISEHESPIRACFSTLRNLFFGLFKKLWYVRRYA